MELTQNIKESIKRSVLCWLATVSEKRMPNVSPKECFNCFGADSIIIANIASPQTTKNIKQNPKVCISFIDVLLQKGYQLKGTAEIIDKANVKFLDMENVLSTMIQGKFPYATITQIKIESAKLILAPSYIFYPETTEEQQIESAKRTYGLNQL